MQKQFKLMILANVFLSLLYVYTNYLIWASFSESTAWFHSIHFDPFIIDYYKDYFVNGQMMGYNGKFNLVNYPFWLFFIAIAVNIYFMYRLQRSKETK